MLMYSEKDLISVDFAKKADIDEFDNYNDIVDDLLNHYSYTNDLDLLDLEFIESETHIKECDYCGKMILRVRSGNYHRIQSNKYIDEDAEYPCTDDCCKSCVGMKNKLVWFEKYGVEHIFKLDKYRTSNMGWEVPCSRPQRYLADLLNGEINVRFGEINGFVDILLFDEDIIVEYDGSGHYLGEHFGKYTYDEKVDQDYERDLIMRSLGYKVIRIESKYDFLPSDKVIVEEINKIKSYFKSTGKEFFKWVIPNSKKDKRYGELREITENDLNRE